MRVRSSSFSKKNATIFGSIWFVWVLEGIPKDLVRVDFRAVELMGLSQRIFAIIGKWECGFCSSARGSSSSEKTIRDVSSAMLLMRSDDSMGIKLDCRVPIGCKMGVNGSGKRCRWMRKECIEGGETEGIRKTTRNRSTEWRRRGAGEVHSSCGRSSSCSKKESLQVRHGTLVENSL
ncbi:hypothetical protein Salat_1979400 [Sesamum alatum]|uniref:Uncharacterized protein n=1 Tax=Sesamum alatum TaxID=300844 RepID=A0AAE2CJ18_9LAMI|nr:hypothetical protein Salat_1979400 [Sesamum alatum]